MYRKHTGIREELEHRAINPRTSALSHFVKYVSNYEHDFDLNLNFKILYFANTALILIINILVLYVYNTKLEFSTCILHIILYKTLLNFDLLNAF